MREQEHGFNYDLEGMKKALSSPSSVVPKIETFEDFERWLEEDE